MITRLRGERLSRGLTLRELGPLVGATHANIAYLERGETKCPRPGLRFRLERFFGLPIEALLAPVPENASDGPKPAAQSRHRVVDAAATGAAGKGGRPDES